MKINIASPLTGTQKSFLVDDEKKLVQLNDKRVSDEIEGDLLGDEFKGYTFKITGGCDKQGFPMKQGVLTNTRVRLLLRRGDVGFQAWRGREGERRRKSVRGCIIASDIAVLNCIISKEGVEKISGLNDHVIPRRLGPKRASKLRKLFNLTKEDDVRKFVIRRYLPAKEGKDGKKRRARTKAPKIQRLITPVVLERRKRKRRLLRERREKSKEERAEYQALLRRKLLLSHHRQRAARLRQLHVTKKKELSQARRKVKKESKKKTTTTRVPEKKAAAAPAAKGGKGKKK